MQHNSYFGKMMFSQRTTQYLIHGKTIVSKFKMDLWTTVNEKPRNMGMVRIMP